MQTKVSALHHLRRTAASLALLAFFASICLAQPPPPGAAAIIATGAVVDFNKLLPLLPEPPAGWAADPAEGSTDDLGETQITTVHRDYSKGEGETAPTTSISILDSVASPEYLESTIAGWDSNTSDADGYTKVLSIEGMPGFETFENDGKHGTLWLVVAKRYILQIETTAQDAIELQEWLKRVDLKKLAEIK